MSYIVLIFNFIIALPKIWAIIKEISSASKKINNKRIENEISKDKKLFDNADNQEDIERATDKYLRD